MHPRAICALLLAAAGSGCEIYPVDPSGPYDSPGYGFSLVYSAEDPFDSSLPLITTSLWDGRHQETLAVGTSPAWSPWGGTILFLDAGLQEISDDGSWQQLLYLGDAFRFPVWVGWSPMGDRYAFLDHSGTSCNAILIAATDSGIAYDYGDQCAADHGRAWRLAWSPRGDELVYHAQGDSPWYDIYVAEVDGVNTWNLTASTWHDHSPTWSPDAQIAYVSTRRTGPFREGELYVMNWDGSESRQLVDGEAMLPSWSPTGDHIAFIGPDDGLFTVDMTTHSTRRLTRETTGRYPLPAALRWSPDGHRIAFVSDSGYLYTIHSDGTEEVRVSDTRIVGAEFDWSPYEWRR